MIVVTMSEKNGLRFELELENLGRNKISVVARIDNETFQGELVPDEVTVGLKLSD